MSMSGSPKEHKPIKAKEGQDNIPKFLKILYQLLDDKGNIEFISWTHDGRAIAIKNPTEFAEKLLPAYFKHNNYSSFVRQLNLYNFKKKKNYPHDNTFAHTMFMKGRKDLLKLIKRKNSHIPQPEKPDLKLEVCSNSDGELNELTDQNVNLKRVHQDMAEKIESLEQALKMLSERNEDLRNHYMVKKQNEDILKKVVNRIAKVYGAAPIRELIESLAYSGGQHSLSLKPSPTKVPDNRPVKHYSNYTVDRSELQSNYRPCFPTRNEFELDRKPADRGSYSLAIPHLRTISSLSTIPDPNQRTDLYQDFEQDFENDLSSSPYFRQVIPRDDFSFAGESRGECLVEMQRY